MAKVFFGTNILPYLRSADAIKAGWAEALIALSGVISVQVLNKLTSGATRNCAMQIAEVREVPAPISALCRSSRRR